MISESKNLIVRKTRNGKGLFIKKSFKPGQKIFQVRGKIIQEEKFVNLSHRIRSNSFRFDSKNYLSPKGETGNFLNHSCNPNCTVKKVKNKLFIISTRNIKSNSELLMDYSTIIASDDFWKMKCKCGEKNCRKVIGKFNHLPKKILKKYLKSKVVPEYILKIKESNNTVLLY